jgi:hypothetical protein
MVKSSSRVTRYFSVQRGRVRTTRAKTFTTEEKAKAWAKEQGYTDYKVENLRSSVAKIGKYRVVVEV